MRVEGNKISNEKGGREGERGKNIKKTEEREQEVK